MSLDATDTIHTSIPEPDASDDPRRTDGSLAAAVTDMLRRRAPGLPVDVRVAIGDVLTRQTAGDTCIATDTPVGEIAGLVARLDAIDEPARCLDAVRTRPFVSAGPYFFAQRQFVDELSVAGSIARLVRQSHDLTTHVSDARLDELLRSARKPDYTTPIDIGRSVLRTNFNLLVGGPGTGKTHNLTRYLALLAEALLAERGEARIAVCAPTGKAATRAGEMLASFCDTEPALPTAVRDVLARVVPSTIHRLLGSKPGARGRFRHDAATPLELDVLVVDEMSMVALPLMARLLEAVPTSCRVLLVGDEAQLESIDVGAVLAELNGAEALRSRGRVGTLTEVFRQDKGSSINDAAYAIRAGDAIALQKVLGAAVDTPETALQWVKVDGAPGVVPKVVDAVAGLLAPAVAAARTTDMAAHASALSTIAGVKVLCGPRHGTGGVHAWNAAIAEALGLPRSGSLPVGTPVLVTVNAPLLHLVNGSIGVVVATADGTRVAFTQPSAADDTTVAPVRYLSLAELPPHEACFAMTVHKSQGSEYGELVVAVVPSVDSPLLTRELVYTALTRAKQRALVVSSEAALTEALGRTARRTSGIGWMLGELLADQL